MFSELAQLADNLGVLLGLLTSLVLGVYATIKYLLPLVMSLGKFFGGMSATQEILPAVMDRVDENSNKLDDISSQIGDIGLNSDLTVGDTLGDHSERVARVEHAIEVLMEQANLYSFLLSLEGEMVYASKSLLHRMESDAEHIYGFSWKSYIPSEEMREHVFREILNAVKEERSAVIRGVSIRMPDGLECECEVHLDPVRAKGKVHIGHFGFIQSENPVLRRAERMYRSKKEK